MLLFNRHGLHHRPEGLHIGPKTRQAYIDNWLGIGGEVRQALTIQLPTTSHFPVTLQVAGSSTC